jgi:hypothetical protein
VWHAACSVSTEHTEQQSNRATEHSAYHVTAALLSWQLGSDERRRSLSCCLGHHYTIPLLA